MRLLTLLTGPPVLILIQQVASIYFLSDFFLARDSLTADRVWKNSHEDVDQLPSDISSLASQVISRHCENATGRQYSFDKIILMVIDAFGADFIPQLSERGDTIRDRMPFLESLIKTNKAKGFVARASSPTVTMPRIKSLLSGTIPSFLDIVYNLASDVRDFKDDNIVNIAKQNHKSLIFYGDDTWLQLFDRSIFTRSRETFSFYAQDYTTVDSNVTDFAVPETAKGLLDWDYMFLHYLGLDHIGHNFYSRDSPKVKPKLLEMDSVIESIYKNMASKDYRTLVVICGDHGMSEDGNHGGDTRLETETAMVFIPINYDISDHAKMVTSRHNTAKQVDFAVTLSLLTEMPIPSRSHGVAIEHLLEALWPNPHSLACGGLQNVLQLAKLLGVERVESHSIGQTLRDLLIEHLGSSEVSNELSHKYFDLSRQIQSISLDTIISRSNVVLVVLVLMFAASLSVVGLRRITLKLLMPVIGKLERCFCLTSFLIPIISLGSMYFVLNEHKFWPTYSLICLLLLIYAAINSKPSLANVEDKFRVILFTMTFIITAFCNNFHLLRGNNLVSILALVVMCNYLRSNCSFRKFRSASAILVFLSIFACKFTDNIEFIDKPLKQQLSLIIVMAYTVFNVSKSALDDGYDMSTVIQRLSSGWMASAYLLARPEAYLFLTANVVMEASLNSIVNAMQFSSMTRAIIYLNFAQSAFYNQGNTFQFSSIDVMPAFYGQASYNIWLAIPLVTCATYATQTYWLMKLVQRVQGVKFRLVSGVQFGDDGLEQEKYHSYNIVHGVCDFINARNFLSLSYFMFVCIILRNHIFVWSVLSPKLIYHYIGNNIALIALSVTSNLYRLFGTNPANERIKQRLVA